VSSNFLTDALALGLLANAGGNQHLHEVIGSARALRFTISISRRINLVPSPNYRTICGVRNRHCPAWTVIWLVWTCCACPLLTQSGHAQSSLTSLWGSNETARVHPAYRRRGGRTATRRVRGRLFQHVERFSSFRLSSEFLTDVHSILKTKSRRNRCPPFPVYR
jgi:hypothetical protein